jgi:hypothetical protein
VDRQDRRKDRHPPTQPERAELYQEWIANDRQLRAIITQMRQVAAKATDLTMKEVKKNKPAKV